MNGYGFERSLRRRAAVQMAYAALLAMFVLWPNMQSGPSLVLVLATTLASLWLVGGLAAVSKVPRADELLLCGSAAPALIGLTQLVYRLNFLWMHGGLTRPGAENDSAASFAAVWAAETFFVLVPGILFLWWNMRNLSPVPPPQPRRPSSTSRRT